MTGIEERVAAHYARAGLLQAITDRLRAMGVAPDRVTAEDLAGVDQFHIGGAAATMDLVAGLGVEPATRVLDLGCGIGGPARAVAARFGCTVTGIDLTPDFVATARALTGMVGLAARVRHETGSILDLPFADGAFDLALLLHVGMNIADKPALCREAFRVLVPGGRFALFEVMRVGEGEPAFPLPWASDPAASSVGTPEDYRRALEGAGFVVDATRERGELGRAFFAAMRERLAASDPPPLTLQVLMGPEGATRMANMRAAVEAGILAPVEMVAVKPAQGGR